MTTHVDPLVLEHVSKSYRSGDTFVQALDDVSLRMVPGEFIAVTGRSGSGKSTLLHCASGLDTCDSGSILLNGNEITRMSDRQLTLLRRSATGFIFQAYNLINTKTARENIVYPLRLQKRRPEKNWLAQVVGSLGIEDLLDRYPNQLSGGQQQRVAVARSMMAQPQILYADEPTGALDSVSSDELLDLFRWCTQQLGVAVMMVTHDQSAAARADRVIEMMDGRVCRELHPETAEAVTR